MKPAETARPPSAASDPEKTDGDRVAAAPPAVNEEQAEMIALVGQLVELVTAVHDLQNEQLHVLRSINSRLP
jgi:hypothetical protein